MNMPLLPESPRTAGATAARRQLSVVESRQIHRRVLFMASNITRPHIQRYQTLDVTKDTHMTTRQVSSATDKNAFSYTFPQEVGDVRAPTLMILPLCTNSCVIVLSHPTHLKRNDHWTIGLSPTFQRQYFPPSHPAFQHARNWQMHHLPRTQSACRSGVYLRIVRMCAGIWLWYYPTGFHGACLSLYRIAMNGNPCKSST